MQGGFAVTALTDLLRDGGFDAVLAGVSDGVTLQDRDGKLRYANHAAARLTGFDSVREMLAASGSEMFERYVMLREDGSAFPIDELPGRRLLSGHEPNAVIIRFIVKRTGEERFSRVIAAPIRADDGSIAYIVNTFTDVSEAKHTERWLRLLADAGSLLASSLEYDQTLQAVAALTAPLLADWCAIDVVDESGRLQRVALHHADVARSPSVTDPRLRHAGYAGESPGPTHVMHTGESRMFSELTSDELDRVAEREGWEPEYRAAIGELSLRSIILAPLVARERTLGVLTLASAESGRRYGEQDLSVAELLARRVALAVENSLLYAEARRAVKARDRFLALAAHELLTPITIVRGYSEAVTRMVQRAMDADPDAASVTVDGPRVRRALTSLTQAGQRLTSLVHDLLDVSRLQQGSLALSPAPMDLSAVVASVLESVQVQRGEGRYSDSITLAADLPASGHIAGTWDRLRIEQVLFNVLDNAMKYSPGGGEVRVRLSIDHDEAQVEVSDQGIGVAPDQLDTIFEPFHRSPRAGEHATGFGMGLAVCREIVRGHGGSITAESGGEGQGVTIKVTLPDAQLVPAPVDDGAAPTTAYQTHGDALQPNI
jgi:PAS domain S-box-containing protein